MNDTQHYRVSILVSGFNETHCTVGQLEEYWVYQFGVMVTNTAGISDARRTGNITTDEGGRTVQYGSISLTFYILVDRVDFPNYDVSLKIVMT